MKSDIIRSNHVGFTVENSGRVAAMFVELFGYQIRSSGGRPRRGVELLTGVPGADIHVVHLHHSELINIELIHYMGPDDAAKIDRRPCDVGHAHLTFDVRNIHALVAAGAAHGLVPVGRVVNTAKAPSEGHQVVYMHSPDGITLELIQPPDREL